MKKVMISYASQDRAHAERLEKALGERGLLVWLDRSNLIPGDDLGDTIRAAIAEAQCIVVIWSHSSVRSRWVMDEARAAKEKLVQIAIEEVEIPLGFGGTYVPILDTSRLGGVGAFEGLVAKIRQMISINEGETVSKDNPAAAALRDWMEKTHKQRLDSLDFKHEVDLHDFENVWGLLFETAFSEDEGCLRDVTFSSHGNLQFQKYDFAGYPLLVRSHIERHARESHEARFLMVCCPSEGQGENNQKAEEFLEEMLKIKYVGVRRGSLLDLWASNSNGSRKHVQVMVTNRSIVERILGSAGGDEFDCPFNVYGRMALSRSVVRGKEGSPDKPVPHLNIVVDSGRVKKYSDIFERVWENSLDFKERVLRELSSGQREKFGSGEVFDLWSRDLG